MDGGIGGENFGAAVQHAVGLIKIYGAGDVRGNDGVVLIFFLDTIDLDGESDWDAVLLQLVGKRDHGRCAPAVAVENDFCFWLSDVDGQPAGLAPTSWRIFWCAASRRRFSKTSK